MPVFILIIYPLKYVFHKGFVKCHAFLHSLYKIFKIGPNLRRLLVDPDELFNCDDT